MSFTMCVFLSCRSSTYSFMPTITKLCPGQTAWSLWMGGISSSLSAIHWPLLGQHSKLEYNQRSIFHWTLLTIFSTHYSRFDEKLVKALMNRLFIYTLFIELYFYLAVPDKLWCLQYFVGNSHNVSLGWCDSIPWFLQEIQCKNIHEAAFFV